MELTYKYIVILLGVFDVTLGIQTYDIKRRDVQATSQSQCSVTSSLVDILKNDLKRLEGRYDDLVDKYSKLLQTTTNLQIKLANFTADKQGASGRDCADLYKNGVKLNGVYTITPDNSPSAFNVYCDMTTDGGGWTLFQKRMDGSVDFYRGWQSYKHGFGNLNGEHWLGNEQINTITNQKRYELRVDMEDANGVWRYAHYDNFAITSEKANYQLTVGAYSGNAGDSLSPHKGHPFTTKDRDNDANGGNCAQHFKGAWWYHNVITGHSLMASTGRHLKGTNTP